MPARAQPTGNAEELEVNEPSTFVNGPLKSFWALHSISPKKTSTGSAPKTPSELSTIKRREREAARLEEVKLKANDPRLPRNPPDPKRKVKVTKQIIPLVATGETS